MDNKIRVFVTYSWDSDEHKEKVLSFTDFLRKRGFDAKNDIFFIQEETSINLNKMMYTNIKDSDKVIIILSKGYKDKADSFRGGVGNEFELIMDDIKNNTNKYILVCMDQKDDEIKPLLFQNRYILSLLEEQDSGFKKLFHLLMNVKEKNFSEIGTLPKIESEPIDEFNLASKKKFFNVPMENKLFTGREEYLKDITNEFKENNIVIINGLGGIGKTQIAKKYAYLNIENYESIYWINADTLREVNTQYLRIAQYLKLDILENDIDLVIEKVKAYFNEVNNTLIIFDNADNIELKNLNQYFPQFNTKIIITTKNSACDTENYFTLELKDMSEKDSKVFLLNNTNSRKKEIEDEQDSVILATELKGYPLALEHARAYINKRKISIKEYIELFKEYRLKIMKNKILDYNETVLTTWEISFNKIKELNKEGFPFLGKCSFLFSNEIPIKELFVDSGMYNVLALDEIIEALMSYSLISVEQNFINIHGIVQEIIREKLSDINEYNKYLEEISISLYKLFPDDIQNEEDRKLTQILMKHMITVSDYKELEMINENLYVKIISNIGNIFYSLGSSNDAIYYLSKSAEYFNRIGRKLDMCIMMDSIGMSYHRISETIRALEILFDAKQILENENDKKVLGNILRSIGIVYKDLNKLGEAMKYHNESLELAKLSEDKLLIINQLTNIGNIYKHEKEYERALENFKSALGLSIQINNDRLIAKAYGSIGSIYRELHEYENAIEYSNKALDIFIQLGDNRSQGICLDNIGCCYRDDGVLKKDVKLIEKAISLFEKALEMSKEVNNRFGEANILLNIGNSYFYICDKENAKKYFYESLSLGKEINHTKLIQYCEENLVKIDEYL